MSRSGGGERFDGCRVQEEGTEHMGRKVLNLIGPSAIRTKHASNVCTL